MLIKPAYTVALVLLYPHILQSSVMWCTYLKLCTAGISMCERCKLMWYSFVTIAMAVWRKHRNAAVAMCMKLLFIVIMYCIVDWLKFIVFWDVTRSLVDCYQQFGGTCCFIIRVEYPCCSASHRRKPCSHSHYCESLIFLMDSVSLCLNSKIMKQKNSLPWVWPHWEWNL